MSLAFDSTQLLVISDNNFYLNFSRSRAKVSDPVHELDNILENQCLRALGVLNASVSTVKEDARTVSRTVSSIFIILSCVTTSSVGESIYRYSAIQHLLTAMLLGDDITIASIL